jgi:hypothetical protein
MISLPRCLLQRVRVRGQRLTTGQIRGRRGPRRFGPPCCRAATAVATKPPQCFRGHATTPALLPPPPRCRHLRLANLPPPSARRCRRRHAIPAAALPPPSLRCHHRSHAAAAAAAAAAMPPRYHRHRAAAADAFVFIVVVVIAAAVLSRCHHRMPPPRYRRRPCHAARCHCPTATMPATAALPPPSPRRCRRRAASKLPLSPLPPRCHRASHRDDAADDTALLVSSSVSREERWCSRHMVVFLVRPIIACARAPCIFFI